MATIAERIKEALEIRKLKQSELVEKTGIGKSSISTYISGEYEPKQRNIYKIAKALNVNEAWLLGLDVPMERISQSELENSIKVIKEFQTFEERIINNYGKTALELLSNYNELNDIGKFEANKRVRELTFIDDYLISPIQNDEMEILDLAAHDDYNAITEDPFNAIDDIKGVLKKAEQQRKNRGK